LVLAVEEGTKMGTVSNILKQLKMKRDRVQKQASEALQSAAVPLTKIVPRAPLLGLERHYG
jgi:hypothetical protein